MANQKTVLAVFLVVLALSVAFSAVTSSTLFPPAPVQSFPDVDGHVQLTLSSALVIGTSLNGNSSLEQPTRLEIYNYVNANPGIHFRGICNGLNLSIGVVQYHLGVLEHAGLIIAYDDGQNKRYFESTVDSSDVALLSLLRHETAGKILFSLSQNNSVLHRDLACGLGISSQALSWQMNHLKKTGLICAEKEGVNVRYSLNPNASENKTLLAFWSDV